MHVNDRDLKKHRKDVLALAVGLLPANLRCDLPTEIKIDMNTFVEDIRSNPLRIDQLGLEMDLDEILEHLETVYGLG